MKCDEKEEIFECDKSIYFECSIANLNLVSNQIWYCHCDDFQGCENYFGSQYYCFIYQVNNEYSNYVFEIQKYNKKIFLHWLLIFIMT